jgi:hypothetical protein
MTYGKGVVEKKLNSFSVWEVSGGYDQSYKLWEERFRLELRSYGCYDVPVDERAYGGDRALLTASKWRIDLPA